MTGNQQSLRNPAKNIRTYHFTSVVPQKATDTEDNAIATAVAITGTAAELARELPGQLGICFGSPPATEHAGNGQSLGFQPQPQRFRGEEPVGAFWTLDPIPQFKATAKLGEFLNHSHR